MNEAVLLQHILAMRGEAYIGVKGVSMQPTLYEDDTIRLVKSEYQIGDILVFPYKHGELLVHRYVGEQRGRILCKGDNAFRLEDIGADAVLGKVASLQCSHAEIPIPMLPETLINMSREIGRLFRRNHYDALVTAAEPLYCEFCEAMKEYAVFRKAEEKV